MVQRGGLARTAAPRVGETFRELALLQNVVIEEIVSSAQPDPTEYRQAHDEWVVVLDGSATLEIDGAEIVLTRNEWVSIAAGVSHRVRRAEPGTRWLAVHVHPLPPTG